jgi:Putative Actinobacterial Holin-X, holin superfamily III
VSYRTGRDAFGADGAKSAGQLMKEITEGFSTLFRKEVELAKQEVGQAVGTKAKGAAIVAIGGVFAFFALIFVLLGLRDGLDEFLWTWVADLVTALILLVIGGIAVMVARNKLRGPVSAELTKKTIKDDVEMAKSLGKKTGASPSSSHPGSTTAKTTVPAGAVASGSTTPPAEER